MGREDRPPERSSVPKSSGSDDPGAFQEGQGPWGVSAVGSFTRAVCLPEDNLDTLHLRQMRLSLVVYESFRGQLESC